MPRTYRNNLGVKVPMKVARKKKEPEKETKKETDDSESEHSARSPTSPETSNKEVPAPSKKSKKTVAKNTAATVMLNPDECDIHPMASKTKQQRKKTVILTEAQ